MTVRPERSGERGYALVALLAAVTIMLILMSAAVPSWRYLMQNDREEELIFRGGEIADAIARFQRRNGNALPPSLDVLVKGKFLRRAYKDPMTRDGKWRLIRPGELVGGMGQNPPAATGYGGRTATTTTTTTTRPSAFARSETVFGGFQGIASRSTEKSLRIFNGKTRYDEWVFLPGQPRVIGKPIGLPFGAGGQPNRPAMPAAIPGAGLPQPGALPPAGGMPNPMGQPYVVPP